LPAIGWPMLPRPRQPMRIM